MIQSTRTLLMLLLCTFISAYGVAQPSLTNSVFFSVGEQFITVQADTTGVDAGNAGANQTWDYSGLTPMAGTPADTTMYAAAGNTPFAMDFPTANLAGVAAGNVFYTYYKKEANRMSYLGGATDTISIQYSDPDIILETPLNFNGSFSDSYESIINDPMAMLIMTGDKTTTYDAYGTLQLPSETYSNAIRLKVERESRDSASFGVGYILTETTATEYLWFQNGKSGPLLTIGYREGTTTIVSPPLPPFVNPIPLQKTVSYLQTGTTGLNELEHLSFSIEEIAPNPAAEALRVSVESAKHLTDVELTIVNKAGQVILRQEKALAQGTNVLTIPVNTLAAGTYWLALRTASGVQSMAWIKR